MNRMGADMPVVLLLSAIAIAQGALTSTIEGHIAISIGIRDRVTTALPFEAGRKLKSMNGFSEVTP
jgi:hypothetical protein